MERDKTDIMKKLSDDVERVLIGENELADIIKRLGTEIDADYSYIDGYENRLLLLGVLKGSVVFMGDLMKYITVPAEIDFMKVSSYGESTKHGGSVNIILDLYRRDLPQTDILIVEDIIDSGRTLSYLAEYLRLKGAKSVQAVTLLDKPDRREVDFRPRYVGKEIPDEFVIGYGLDYAEKYRTLPYVGILKREVYEKQL